jgi:hypothetical protein
MVMNLKETIFGDLYLYFVINSLWLTLHMVYVFIFMITSLYYFLGYDVSLFLCMYVISNPYN